MDYTVREKDVKIVMVELHLIIMELYAPTVHLDIKLLKKWELKPNGIKKVD
jgi:hypothetical protein